MLLRICSRRWVLSATEIRGTFKHKVFGFCGSVTVGFVKFRRLVRNQGQGLVGSDSAARTLDWDRQGCGCVF